MFKMHFVGKAVRYSSHDDPHSNYFLNAVGRHVMYSAARIEYGHTDSILFINICLCFVLRLIETFLKILDKKNPDFVVSSCFRQEY